MGRKPNLNDEKRAVVSPESYAKYIEMRDALKIRDVSNFTFAQYFDLILSKMTPQMIAQIIEEATPKDYKIKLALQDDALKEEILRLFEAREKKRLKEKPPEAVN
jgi:hypothetical protein